MSHLHNFPISRSAIWFGTLCLHNLFRWFDGWLWLLSNFHFDFISSVSQVTAGAERMRVDAIIVWRDLLWFFTTLLAYDLFHKLLITAWWSPTHYHGFVLISIDTDVAGPGQVWKSKYSSCVWLWNSSEMPAHGACLVFGLQLRSNNRKKSKQVSGPKVEAHYMTLNIVSVKEFRLWVHSIVVYAVKLVGYRVKWFLIDFQCFMMINDSSVSLEC